MGDLGAIVREASKIKGWMSESELFWLAWNATQRKCIVEFGSYQGRSTKALAATSGVVHAVEPNISDDLRANINHELSSGKVVLHKARSVDFQPAFDMVDMVFIDASHDYANVCADIEKGMELLMHGGLLCGHDFIYEDWPGVKRAVSEKVLGYQIAPGTSIWFKEMPNVA